MTAMKIKKDKQPKKRHCMYDQQLHLAGNTRRTRSRDEEAESSDGSNGSKHKRSRMERVVSIGTALRCVDRETERNGSFDDAVGELPATVHEMTEGWLQLLACAGWAHAVGLLASLSACRLH